MSCGKKAKKMKEGGLEAGSRTTGHGAHSRRYTEQTDAHGFDSCDLSSASVSNGR